MKKKPFRVNVQDRSYKTNNLLRQKRKQKTIYSKSERFKVSLRCFNEKNKTTSDNRAAISSSAPSKMKENKKPDNKKKITNRNRKQSFSCFFNNTYKRTNFSVFDDHIYVRHFKTFKEKNGCLKTGKKTRPYITHLHNNDEKSRPLILRIRCD